MKKIEEMTLQEKIGQLLMVGYPADDLDGMLELIDKYKIGNVILFTRNIKDGYSLVEQNKRLQKQAMEKLNIPLYISIDQEGGMVTRIMNDATFFPGNMTVSATKKVQNAYQIGEAMGKELRLLGINMNLAPVLDVNNNINNPVIGVRSYGDQAKEVAEFGAHFVDGLQKSNVLATGKHFPGHGDTSVDSHLDLTTVNHDKKRLNEVELVPFKEAIDHNIGAIMSAHVLFPAYDDDKKPATLSKKVLTDLLRTELGFKGLIVTDCMEMKAIDTYFTTEKATVDAVDAGANLVCISHTKSKQIGAMEELIKAVEEGRLDEQVIDDAVSLVLEHKKATVDDVNSFINMTYDEIKEQVDTKAHNELSQSVCDEALTLVNGKPFTKRGKVLFVAPNPYATTIADDELDTMSLISEVKKEFNDFDTVLLKINPDEENMKEIIRKAETVDQVVFCSYNANIYKNQLKVINQLKEQVKDIHIIALRNPYDLIELNEMNAVCIYEYTPKSIQTVIKYLKNEIKPTGTLPVQL